LRRTFGLTALLLLAVTVLALAGCTGGASSGAGVIQPFPTGSITPSGTATPKPSPSVGPVPSGVADVLTSRRKPTRMAVDATTQSIFMVEGFNQGVGQGRLVRFAMDTENNQSDSDPQTPQVFEIEQVPARAGMAPEATNLTSPVWITGFTHPRTGKYTLAITENFGTGQGRVLVIEPEFKSSKYTGKARAVDLGSLASSRPINPLACSFDGRYLWWTEYIATPQGRIRRADLSLDPPVVVDYMVGLNFPAGIASNGSLVAVAQNDAGTILVGRVRPQPEQYPAPLAGAYTLTPKLGDPQMRSPFEVAWTGEDTLVTLDGFSMPGQGIGTGGTGNGNLRFFAGPGDDNFSNRTLKLVKSGLTNPVGLEVTYDAAADPKVRRVYVTFVESMATAGKVWKVYFKTDDDFKPEFAATISELNGFQWGFHVMPREKVTSPQGTPLQTIPLPRDLLIFMTQGFHLGVSNGSIVRYNGPTED